MVALYAVAEFSVDLSRCWEFAVVKAPRGVEFHARFSFGSIFDGFSVGSAGPKMLLLRRPWSVVGMVAVEMLMTVRTSGDN